MWIPKKCFESSATTCVQAWNFQLRNYAPLLLKELGKSAGGQKRRSKKKDSYTCQETISHYR